MYNRGKVLLAISIACVMAVGASPIFAAPTENPSQPAQVNVEPTIAITANWNGTDGALIDFGSLMANNMPNIFTGDNETTPHTYETITDYSNVAIKLLTRGSGDFTDGSDTFGLDNLQYSGYGNSSLPSTALTTTDTQVKIWGENPQGTTPSVPVTYTLTIPWNTHPGVYTTTIYHTAEAA